MFIANLSLMSDSLGVPTHQRMVYVRTVSYCNCFGRILAGVALDSAEARCGVPRPAHYLWTSGVLVCAAALLRTVPDDGTCWSSLGSDRLAPRLCQKVKAIPESNK